MHKNTDVSRAVDQTSMFATPDHDVRLCCIACLAGVRERVESALGGPLDGEPKICLVREVAPNKRMLCVSFQLPAAIAESQQAELQPPSDGDAAPRKAAQPAEPQPPAKNPRY